MDEAELRKVAALARLRIEDAEVGALVQDLEAILGYVRCLQSADLSSKREEQAATLDESSSEGWLPLRADGPFGEGSLGADKATENAPASEAGSFLVPRVIG